MNVKLEKNAHDSVEKHGSQGKEYRKRKGKKRKGGSRAVQRESPSREKRRGQETQQPSGYVQNKHAAQTEPT